MRKIVVRQEKEKAYQEVYEKLDSKEEEKVIYNMVKKKIKPKKTVSCGGIWVK